MYSAGIPLGSLHQSSVTMSRMTYFILRPPQERALATANTAKLREMFWIKIKANGARRQKLARSNSLAVGEARCMAIF